MSKTEKTRDSFGYRVTAGVGVAAICILIAWVWHLVQDFPSASGPSVDTGRQNSSETAPQGSATRAALADTGGLPTVSGQAFLTGTERIQPQQDEWPSEVFVDQATAVLDQLKHALVDPATYPDVAAKLLAPEFQVAIASEGARQVDSDPAMRVSRIEWGTPRQEVTALQAPQAFWQQLIGADRSGAANNASIKITGVQLEGQRVDTTLWIEVSENSASSAWQQISRWNCQWFHPAGESPRLTRAELITAESVTRIGTAWFADQTPAVLGGQSAFEQQLRYGLHDWLGRIETAHGMHYFSKHGLAVGDVNGDGLEDVYVCQPAALPNRLLLQDANGGVRDVAAAWGVDVLDRTASALLVDLDNDGDQDLALATMMGLVLYENVNSTSFRRQQLITLPDVDLQGLSAVDYDRDGDLDLYQLVDYASPQSRSAQGLPSFIYHDANDGGANHLLRNDLDGGPVWRFTDVTAQVGLDVNNHRHSLAAAWEDFDNDSDMDLYVANDYGPNCLYRNDGGKFVEVAVETGTTDTASGMSVSWGDYDRDGQVDLYVGNMFSTAGSRITSQDRFLEGVDADRRAAYPRFAKGNSLFRNDGQGHFQDVGAAAGVEMGRWSWSSLFADVNNDGWQDLLVANGYLTTPDTGDL